MIALVQRVLHGAVRVEQRLVAEIGKGYVVLLGVAEDDHESDAKYLAERTANLRIFPDETGRMNRSIQEIAGDVLVVSQFTLCADTRKGNRPSFVRAASREKAETLYIHYVDVLRAILGNEHVVTGIFRADMLVTIENDGPVTILLQTREKGGTNPTPSDAG